MALPKIPSEITESAWEKACGGEYKRLEKELKIGSVLAVLCDTPNSRQLQVFTDLEAAVKSKDGGEIQSLYQKTDAVFDAITRLKRMAKDYAGECKDAVSAYSDDSAAKAAVAFLGKSGPAAVAYANDLETFGEELLSKAEQVPLEKIVDLDWELNDWDLTHLLTKVLGIKLKAIELPDKKPVTVHVTGKAGASAAKNATLRAEFFEAAYAAGKALGPALKTELEFIDDGARKGKIRPEDVPKRMAAAFKSFEDDYEKKADVAIQKIWTDLGKDQEEYRSYKIKTAVSIGSKVGGLAVGVVGLVTTGWTGVGTVLSLLALVKSTIDLARKIADGLEEARDMAKRIAVELKDLQTEYAKNSKAVIGVKEVASDVLSRLTSIQLNTIKTMGDSLKLFKSKIKGCNVNATAMGTEIDKLFKEADALAAKISKAEAMLKGLKGVNIGKLRGKHDQLMAEVGKIVTAAANFKEDYVKGRESLATWEKQVKDLEGDVPEVAVKIQKWVVPLVDFVYVTDVEGAITKTGSLAREYLVVATETEDELSQANEVGDLLGDVSVLVTGIVGK